MKPRNTLAGTRAEALLQQDLFRRYLQHWLVGGADDAFGDGRAVFREEALQALSVHCSEKALSVPLTLTDRLSNRVLAICHLENGNPDIIAVNGRFRTDPDQLVHVLIEEYVHAQQALGWCRFCCATTAVRLH